MGVEVKDALNVKQLTIASTGKLYMADGTIVVSSLTTNASNNVTISNVAPAGVGTATISAWLSIVVGTTTYYIPCWT